MKKLFTGKQAIALLLCLTLLSVIFLAGCDNSTPAPSENPTPPTVAVESVLLNQTALTMAIGDIVTLVATVLPSDATDRTVTFSSSNPAPTAAQTMSWPPVTTVTLSRKPSS